MLTTSFPRFRGDAAGHFVLELAAEIAKEHDVTVVAPFAENAPGKEKIRNVNVHRFHYFFPRRFERLAYGEGIIDNIRRAWWSRVLIPFFSVSFLLRSIVIGARCDVIHAHWGFSGLIAVVGKIFHRKPVVVTLRGSDVNIPVGGGVLSKLLLKLVVKGCDYVTTVSDDLAEKIKERCGTRVKARIVPNGVAADLFHPLDLNAARGMLRLEPSRPVILYVGRLTKTKGVDVLLDALPLIVSASPESLFVFLGEGNLVKTIADQCEKQGIQGNVVLAGSKPHEEIPTWLNAANVVVLPSLSEGRPNVVIESMACGRPIVATRVGGIPELITDGENGFLVPPGDASALTRAVVAVLAMDDQGAELGRRGYEVVKSRGLDWRRSAERMIEVYEQVMKDS